MFPAPHRIGAHRVLLASTAALVVLGLLTWWLWPREQPPTGTITISTGPQSGVYHDYGERLRTAIARDMPGLKVELLTSDGSQQNVTRVAGGEADLSIAAADAVESYEGPGRGRLRGLARLYDDYVQVVVPHSSDIENISDLKGKRVGVGGAESGVRLIATRVLRAAGLDPEKDIVPRSDSIGTAPDRLRNGEIDAFFWSGGLPTGGLIKLAEVYDFRFIPISGDLVTELHVQGETTRYYRSSVMPGDAYSVQQGAPVQTLTVANLLVTRSDLDPRLTEWLTRVVIKSRDNIGSHVHAAQLVDLRTAIYTDPLPLHEGARRYYRSVKP
ncbi:TAXI family TRAP transporter solute-binding subunit [Streptomyces sp. KM273126]|uniref:TAXI family TRAP transporter solute-binding subunit n=1 Tax=Streptomyces sp. KM273126 TaxID=2545247 RepID=UPI001038660D|nr:TAXI family TRAP transporter solute-binding subunit [Streptomyces sp. KM273126]MBA2809470.1 TAXI family TRAP transporter solute-binding subunit [Streptomyces sp. KM273126]